MQSEFDLEFNLKADTVSVIHSMLETTIQVDFSQEIKVCIMNLEARLCHFSMSFDSASNYVLRLSEWQELKDFRLIKFVMQRLHLMHLNTHSLCQGNAYRLKET